jgi:hypothetical protein
VGYEAIRAPLFESLFEYGLRIVTWFIPEKLTS